MFLNGLVSRSKTGSTKLVWVVDGLRRKTKGLLINLENRTLKLDPQFSKRITIIKFPLSVHSVLILVPLALELESLEAIGLTVGPWKSWVTRLVQFKVAWATSAQLWASTGWSPCTVPFHEALGMSFYWKHKLWPVAYSKVFRQASESL